MDRVADTGPVADAPMSDLLDAAAAYLRSIGVEPVVIGGVAVLHDPTDRKHNHYLGVKFTAKTDGDR